MRNNYFAKRGMLGKEQDGLDSYKPKPRDEAAETIECFIIRNNLCPHDKLPSQREMCAMWSFNRVTLCSAIERLTQEGKLYSRPGSGVYVAPPKIQRNLLRLYPIGKQCFNHRLHHQRMGGGGALGRAFQQQIGL